jgi:membrane-bound ClpP family serine protease
VATRVSARLSRSEGRHFGLVVGGAFLALGGILAFRGRSTVGIGLATLGAVLIAAGVLIPTRLGPVHAIWMGLARAISKVTTPVFMSIVFFLVLTPIGLLARAMGHRPLTMMRGRGTSWVDRATGERRSDLERQF